MEVKLNLIEREHNLDFLYDSEHVYILRTGYENFTFRIRLKNENPTSIIIKNLFKKSSLDRSWPALIRI